MSFICMGVLFFYSTPWVNLAVQIKANIKHKWTRGLHLADSYLFVFHFIGYINNICCKLFSWISLFLSLPIV